MRETKSKYKENRSRNYIFGTVMGGVPLIFKMNVFIEEFSSPPPQFLSGPKVSLKNFNPKNQYFPVPT